jgi:hypothetical protein
LKLFYCFRSELLTKKVKATSGRIFQRLPRKPCRDLILEIKPLSRCMKLARRPGRLPEPPAGSLEG